MSLFDGVGRNPADVKDKLIESVQRERPGSHLCVDLGRSRLVQAGSRKYPFSLNSWEPPVNQISPMGLCCLSPSSEFAAQTVRRTRKGRQMSWYRAGCALALAGFLASSCSVADNSNAASTHPTNSQSQSGHDPALSNDADGHHDAKPSGEGEFNSATTDAKFEFADWVPERGPADTSDPDFELFNLCDEAPDSVWERAGLYFHENLSETKHLGTHISCFLGMSSDLDESYFMGTAGSIGITVDDYSKSELESNGEIINIPVESPIPGLHFTELPHSHECTAGFETVEGRINFGDSGQLRGLSQKESCEIALRYLENIVLKQNSRG